MDNIVTYVEKNLEPITLENFTSVDSLILSWMSYLHFPDTCNNALFTVLTDNDAQTWRELLADWQKNLPSTINALTRLTPEAKKFLLQTIKELLTLSIKCFPDMFHGNYSVSQN